MEQRSKTQVSEGMHVLLPACNSFLEASNKWSSDTSQEAKQMLGS